MHSLLSVVGGTSLTGGEGSILGTVIGAAIMGVLRTGLNLVGVEAHWLPSAQGLIIILAITLGQWFRRCQGMRGGLSKLLADSWQICLARNRPHQAKADQLLAKHKEPLIRERLFS